MSKKYARASDKTRDAEAARMSVSLVIPKETLDTWSDDKVLFFQWLCMHLVVTGEEAPKEDQDAFKEMK